MDLPFEGISKLLEKINFIAALAITLGLVGFVFPNIDVATPRGWVQTGFIFCVAYLLLHSLSKFLHLAKITYVSRAAAHAAQANAAREDEAKQAERILQIGDRLAALNEGQSVVLCEIKFRGAREFQGWRDDPVLNALHALRFIEKDRIVGGTEALWIVPRDVWGILEYPISEKDRHRIAAQRPSWDVRFENHIRRRRI